MREEGRMVRRPASARTASLGVTQARHAVETGMRWLFREQPFEDYGIDAHIEVVDDETVLGRLVALQIKSGRSYFDSPADESGWWFRCDAMHFEYWLDFSIPVIVVLVDLESGLCYWQVVTESTVERSDGGQWKLRVPQNQILDSSAVRPIREVAEKGARLRRRWGSPIGSFSAADLEVHSSSPSADALSEYIVRTHDRSLDELVAEAVGSSARSRCVILVGGSCTGKTRALYEAMHRRGIGESAVSLADAGWRLWPETNPLPPKRFMDELRHVGPKTVVWLNEAQRYLRDPSDEVRTEIATALREIVADEIRRPVLILATLWPEHWQELTHLPSNTEVDRFAAARRLLSGNYLRVPETFTNAEVSMARQSGDQLLSGAAVQVADAAVTQQLAGAPDLLQRYETADTVSQAVVHAAMDARRLGHGEWLSATFLRAVAYCYLADADRRRADEDPFWFEAVAADLMAAGPASGPLLSRSLLGYRLDDFLDQDGRIRRRFEFPNAEFWTVVAESEISSDSRIRMADEAAARERLRIAAHLYEGAGTAGDRLGDLATRCEYQGAPDTAERLARCAGEAGVPRALTFLATLRIACGRKDVVPLLRQATEFGDIEAFEKLAYRLEAAGDKEGAESVARQALALGSWKAMVSVAGWRDIDFPDEAEKMLYDLPEEMRWAALAEFASDRDSCDDPEGAEKLAVAVADLGHLDVLLRVADERQEGGNTEQARRLLALLPRPSTPEDTLRVALSQARAGAHDQARALLAELSRAHHLDAQVKAIVEASPHLSRSLFDVLTALAEHNAAYSLVDRTPQLPKSVPRDDEDRSRDLAATIDEVAEAYAKLAGFHSRHGRFGQAESLAMAASMLGNSAGLITLSQELLQRNDYATAEWLALCAVNMSDIRSLAYPDREPRSTLAQARGEETLLTWGLEADGTTAEPW